MKPYNVGRMADQTSDGGPALAEAEGARHALVEAALRAYDDAGLSGLCAEGRWEAAVSALRGLDLRAYGSPRGGGAARPTGERFAARAAAAAAAMPTPGGGSVAAVAGMLAATLARMVTGLTVGRLQYRGVEAEMRDAANRAAALGVELTVLVARDAAACAEVAAAHELPRGHEPAAQIRAAAVERALLHATEVPLEIARAAAEVAELGAFVAEYGNINAVSDAGVAVLLAEAACLGAVCAIRVNVTTLAGARDTTPASRFADAASVLAARASLAKGRAAAAVERACARQVRLDRDRRP
jgi:formiminotetrahydrofolate cyclodeaminase